MGESTNGIKNRPNSHEDKNVNWDYCYVFTSNEVTTINGSIILYLENCLKSLINNSEFYKSETILTTGKAVNQKEIDICEKSIMPYIVEVLDIFGINLRNHENDKKDEQKQLIQKSDTDYSMFNFSDEMNRLIVSIEIMYKGIDKRIEPHIKEKRYINFMHPSRCLAYLTPLKKDNAFRVYLIGNPDWYNDSRLEYTSAHYRGCNTMFIVKNSKDVDLLHELSLIAISKM